jgi:hypothetical protein
MVSALPAIGVATIRTPIKNGRRQIPLPHHPPEVPLPAIPMHPCGNQRFPISLHYLDRSILDSSSLDLASIPDGEKFISLTILSWRITIV